MREEFMPSSVEEWRSCIYAVEAAKSRMYHKSGFSPAQCQLGENVRLPGNLGSDGIVGGCRRASEANFGDAAEGHGSFRETQCRGRSCG